MEIRKVLCFNFTDTQRTQLKRLRLEGWEIHAATQLDEIKRLADIHQFHIGMVVLEEAEEISISLAKELFAIHHPMEWIALLPSTVLIRPDVCQFVTHYFYDYHTFPIDPDRLKIVLGHAYGMIRMRQKTRSQVHNDDQQKIRGSSPSTKRLRGDIRKVACVDESVLIIGESGTGKELAARAIHQCSVRADKPFIAVNCGVLPQNLIQSELFGYERGAFTGANQLKLGLIEAAAGGTVFLDEIGDLSLDLQIYLLRFLQEKTIHRLGGVNEISIDVRIIAATHVDLEKAVAARRFREDLYYRLNVLHIKVSPLRERREDIEPLANYYFELFSSQVGGHSKVKGFTPEALDAMRYYDWPGNVRELVNRIKRAMIMSENHLITSADLELSNPKARSWNIQKPIVTLNEAKTRAEKEAIQIALQITGNNISLAAKQLGVSRTTFYRLMDK